MRLNVKTISAIKQALNAAGFSGYRKDLCLRVDLDTNRRSLNCLALGDTDLDEVYGIDSFRGSDLEPVGGLVQLDVWVYLRGQLCTDVDVYLADVGPGLPAIWVNEKPSEVDIFKAACSRVQFANN